VQPELTRPDRTTLPDAHPETGQADVIPGHHPSGVSNIHATDRPFGPRIDLAAIRLQPVAQQPGHA
jgi:hypothetical protein